MTARSDSAADAVSAASVAEVGAPVAHALRGAPTAWLVEAAFARRERARGRRVTWSPKVFLPLTNLCRNACGYCSFRRNPDEPGAWSMSPDEVDALLDAGAAMGCTEALFCLGDTPESFSASYRALLQSWGYASTVDHLVHAGTRALERGLLPHTNAGVLPEADLARLRGVNASQGLMLESAADRLTEPGGPHHGAPDKVPAVRLAVHEAAGRQRIPFTSGILVGIGETEAERVDALLLLADLERRLGHLQEVIVQRFTWRPGVRTGPAEPTDDEVVRAVALARLVLPDSVSVQVPPNLSTRAGGPEDWCANERLLAAGADDFGGISPLTPDFINPRHAWPHLDRLGTRVHAAGFDLQRRLPVHARFVAAPGWLSEPVRWVVEARS